MSRTPIRCQISRLSGIDATFLRNEIIIVHEPDIDRARKSSMKVPCHNRAEYSIVVARDAATVEFGH